MSRLPQELLDSSFGMTEVPVPFPHLQRLKGKLILEILRGKTSLPPSEAVTPSDPGTPRSGCGGAASQKLSESKIMAAFNIHPPVVGSNDDCAEKRARRRKYYRGGHKMSRYYQRPENALKKANEFIEVGKPTRALDTLYDVIKGKKHRSFSEKLIEPIMLKYLELCVELKKPHTAKEGLYQYRMMCQSVNVGLLEKVIRSFIKMAEEKTEAAREALKKEVVEPTQEMVEVDDLDNLSMAEMNMLNVVTEEQAQERSDRAQLIPWVKFLWESYTQCLDLLRNNARLENLYHDIAQMAFKFCLSYSRKTEFRKLCERLRKHFDDIVTRQGSQINSIDFSSPETQQLNMETRLQQLDSSITMELWQEAYKAIEDIHLLMNQSKKLQTRMMAYYYQKLSLVFWKAGNLLFHAATLLKYFLLCKDMKKNVSPEELQKNASQVSLATLAISFPVQHPEFERFVETDKGMLEKSQRLAMLLFLPQPPTRASLMKDLVRYGVLSGSIAPLTDLYEILETQFNPLDLCQNVNGVLNTLQTFQDHEYIEQYIEPVQDVALVRMIKQISQVYQSIDYDHLMELTVFAEKGRVEQILVDAVRYNDMQITIDHRGNCIKFGSSLAEASREDLPEGPHLQPMPSEDVRLQLVNVVTLVNETMEMIGPFYIKSEDDILRQKIVSHYLHTEKQSHLALLQRQKLISDRREELERTAADREIEEKNRTELMAKQQMALEAKRLETEREERQKRHTENQRQKIREDIVKQRIKSLHGTPFGKQVINRLEEDDLSKMDVETVIQRQQEEMAKEAKEKLARLKAQEKRLDHLERAKRQEEISVIKKHVEEKKEREKREWEAHENERITHLIEERKIAVTTRDRFLRMREDKNTFLQGLLESRKHVFLQKLQNFEAELNRVRAQRKLERKERRKEERMLKYRQAMEEEERRRQEEQRRIEEERAREEREKTERELEEKNRKTLEKQLAKQREIDEREERKRDEDRRPERPPTGGADLWRSPSKLNAERVAGSQSVTSQPSSGAWIPSRKRVAMEASASGMPPPTVEKRNEWRNDKKDRDREWDRDRDSRGAFESRRDTPRIPRNPEKDRIQGEDSWRSPRGGGGMDRDQNANSPRMGGNMNTPYARGDGRDREGNTEDNWRHPARKEEVSNRK